jgi:TolA-binding protein
MGDFYYSQKNWEKSAYYYELGMQSRGDEPVFTDIFYKLAESAFNVRDYYTAKQYYDSCLQYSWLSADQRQIYKNRNFCLQYLNLN